MNGIGNRKGIGLGEPPIRLQENPQDRFARSNLTANFPKAGSSGRGPTAPLVARTLPLEVCPQSPC